MHVWSLCFFLKLNADTESTSFVSYAFLIVYIENHSGFVAGLRVLLLLLNSKANELYYFYNRKWQTIIPFAWCI